MAAEHDDIMGQIYIAFGQGAGNLRVSRKTCAELRNRYYGKIDKALPQWDAEGAQALERIRTLGRMMAADATNKGLSSIMHTGDAFKECAETVEQVSGVTGGTQDSTIFCT
jgi:hypothetical protein